MVVCSGVLENLPEGAPGINIGREMQFFVLRGIDLKIFDATENTYLYIL